jgi:hypothetical protein
MPTGLRQQLFLHLCKNGGAGQPGQAEGVPLTRGHAIALLREVSFHRAGARLRVLLNQLAYGEAAKPPSRNRMIEALEEDGAHLGRYLATLNRMTAKVTGHPGAKLCEYHKTSDAYTAHAATREILRELFLTMKASGKLEEPLWE